MRNLTLFIATLGFSFPLFALDCPVLNTILNDNHISPGLKQTARLHFVATTYGELSHDCTVTTKLDDQLRDQIENETQGRQIGGHTLVHQFDADWDYAVTVLDHTQKFSPSTIKQVRGSMSQECLDFYHDTDPKFPSPPDDLHTDESFRYNDDPKFVIAFSFHGQLESIEATEKSVVFGKKEKNVLEKNTHIKIGKACTITSYSEDGNTEDYAPMFTLNLNQQFCAKIDTSNWKDRASKFSLSAAAVATKYQPDTHIESTFGNTHTDEEELGFLREGGGSIVPTQAGYLHAIKMCREYFPAPVQKAAVKPVSKAAP